MPKCKNCGYENKDIAEFCIECGSPLDKSEKTCPHCGMQNRKTAIFCIECGKKIKKDTTTESGNVREINSSKDKSNDEVEPISKVIRKASEETTVETPKDPKTEETTVKSPIAEKTGNICSKCGHENPEDSKFCNICGNKLDVSENICPNCGKENPKDSSFCNSCGTNLKKENFIFCQLCGTKNEYNNFRCSNCNQILLK